MHKVELIAEGWIIRQRFNQRSIFISYKKYGLFDLNYQIAADYDFMLRILSNGIKTSYVSEYFVKMRVGGKSNSVNNLMNKMNEDLKILD